MSDHTPWISYILPVFLSLGLIFSIGMVTLTYFTYKHYLLAVKLLQVQKEERRLENMKWSKKKKNSKKTKRSSKSSKRTNYEEQMKSSDSSNKIVTRIIGKDSSKKSKRMAKPSKRDELEKGFKNAISKTSRVESTICELSSSAKSKNTNKAKTNSKSNKEVESLGGDLRVLVKKIAPFLDDFAHHPEQFDVCKNVIPGFLYNSLPSHAPENPCEVEEIWQDFRRIVWPGLVLWQHPRFFGYYPCGRSTPDSLAEMIISALGVPTSEWESCPPLAELEVAMINWTGRALGLPEEMLFQGNTETSVGGGCVTESASESIFLAVLAARTKKIDAGLRSTGEVTDEHVFFSPRTKKRLDRHHDVAAKLVVYSSKEAHSSIEKACRMATVRYRPLQGDSSLDYSLTGEIFEKAIKEDLNEGRVPCMVHVTLGTTSSCAFDRLVEIGPIAKKYGIWVHVDGAYAGALWIEPNQRGTQAGMGYVDSIDINLHKMLLHSNSMSLLWTRHQAEFRAAFATRSPRKKKSPGYNACEWGLHDNKRHKALKMYLVFRLMGTDGLKEYINRTCECAGRMRELMLSHPNIRMFGDLKPAVFSFQYIEEGMSEQEINYYTDKLRMYLNESGQIFVTNSSVQGKTIMRISVGYEKVCKEDMDNTWELMKKFIETFKERKNDPTLVKFPPSPPKKSSS